MLQLLADIQAERGLTYLFISHNLGVVRQISERILVMRTGRIVEAGATEDVLRAPQQEYTRALRRAALDPATMRGRKPRDVVRSLQGASA